ncbi:MAG TPA: hypothetical protein VE961_13805 [Pyrinomonadaceae bacterium]|nr:hypothetical protein [Pyrinomonadaceae bacterium]
MRLVNLLPEEYLGDDLQRADARLLVIESLPLELADYIAMGDTEADRGELDLIAEGGVLGRYSDLWIARVRLRNIARLAQGQLLYSIRRTDVWILDAIAGDGTIYTAKDLFSEATVDVQANKIGRCLICGDIFWKKRSHAKQCGKPKCKNALAVQNFRDPDRRAKYYINRKVREYEQQEQRKSSAKKRTATARKR